MVELIQVQHPFQLGLSYTQMTTNYLNNPSCIKVSLGVFNIWLWLNLIYLVVKKFNQFVHASTVQHWQACKKVLRYLRGIIGSALKFQLVKALFLKGFTNANWANNIDDRRSTSGYCIFLGRNLIQWSSRKQNVVARSSTKSEYRALAQDATEIVWLQSLFSELGLKTV